MLFLTLPAMTIALIPIILLEAFLARRYLKLPFRRLIKICGITNLVSTFVGVPLTWFVLVFLEIITGGDGAHGIDTPLQKFLAVTWQAPWLIPYESDLGWMIPAAYLILLVPFYFASWWIEFLVARRLLREVDKGLLRRTIGKVNFVSYCCLSLFALLSLFG